MKTTKDLIKAIEDLFELFDTNDVVRNTDKDYDFKFFTEQGLRITNVLSRLEKLKSKLASLREKDEEPELRDELIKFMIWYNRHFDIKDIEKDVDEYLKSR
jgi:GTP-binding protein EngB required for normal cell division